VVEGRDFAIPEDVRDLAADVLSHRLVLDARAHGDRSPEEARWIVEEIVGRVPVPL
jgi:MoxR-like ATPase